MFEIKGMNGDVAFFSDPNVSNILDFFVSPVSFFFSIGNIVEMYLHFFPILDSQSCNKYLNEETLHSNAKF